MTLWRISNYRLLDGAGGLEASGRWHTRGRRIVYCSENAATAMLEVLAHLEIDVEDQPTSFRYLEIEVPDLIPVETASMHGDWRRNLEKTRAFGDEWLQSGRTALLRVPSVLTPSTWNVLINPLHPDAAQIRIVRTLKHPIDSRLIR